MNGTTYRLTVAILNGVAAVVYFSGVGVVWLCRRLWARLRP